MRTYNPPTNTPPLPVTQLVEALRSIFENKSLPEFTRYRAVSFLKDRAPSERDNFWQMEVQSFLVTQKNFSNFNLKSKVSST